MLAAFSDFKFNETLVEEGADMVICTQHITGTHTGTLALPGLPPVPATGKKVAMPEEKQVFTFRDGKFARAHSDPVPGGGVMGILAQLGVKL
jgi:predicted ester cyclase